MASSWYIWLRRLALSAIPLCLASVACETVLEINELPPAGDYPLIIDAAGLSCDAIVGLDAKVSCPEMELMNCPVPLIIQCDEPTPTTIQPKCICPLDSGMGGGGGSGGVSSGGTMGGGGGGMGGAPASDGGVMEDASKKKDSGQICTIGLKGPIGTSCKDAAGSTPDSGDSKDAKALPP